MKELRVDWPTYDALHRLGFQVENLEKAGLWDRAVETARSGLEALGFDPDAMLFKNTRIVVDPAYVEFRERVLALSSNGKDARLSI